MNLPNIDSDVTIILSIVATLITAGLGIRKAQAVWAKDGSNIATSDANSSNALSVQTVTELMRKEMERMSESNKTLMEQIIDFQTKNIKLAADVMMLNEQISAVKIQNASLQAEISTLRDVLADFPNKCIRCEFKQNLGDDASKQQ